METAVHRDALMRFGSALSDPTRAGILLSLRSRPGYPSELADEVGVSRQITSNHLACLRGCGLVVAVPEGRRTRYELADDRIGRALDDLVQLVLTVDPSYCPADEGCC
ncbi:winged helix-turn-helix transcriptional regulator [Mycobacterium sp. CBMA271]|uniref:ArsR/SmtB family transcription factor n=1 Tax=unclassified Mycobacteroides TaxID=2618759 RepID=UPI0012DBEF23|nr:MULTISPECIES: winged helix-turn-helix domain-containing protein [unclassified Mycobacteroides]MUM17586.1 transcriptional regulator [Mycobacteroides sp. CBMA 326]MUM24619.1 winged helix-turn-helix transcriptional regulator [Mycobacteroides sp. CBMA 271]